MQKHWFITGGLGFIGINTALSLLREGAQVTVFDNYSRDGAEHNSELLAVEAEAEVIRGDLVCAESVENALAKTTPDTILHLGAQVAVTTSVKKPRFDFESNAIGTFNLLEAARQYCPESAFLNASTNKVYGALSDLTVEEKESRYTLPDYPYGVPVERPLDFHTPYGCSKGAADQYVLDYARIYDMPTVSFRQSCIYGPHQYGVEDQGWIAWFTIAVVLDRPITVYGNGKQVRDLLHVQDLVELYVTAAENIDTVKGHVYNVGGGPSQTFSLRELLQYLSKLSNRTVDYSMDEWRPGDQPVYISDIRRAEEDLGWVPQIGPEGGVKELYDWVVDNQEEIEKVLG